MSKVVKLVPFSELSGRAREDAIGNFMRVFEFETEHIREHINTVALMMFGTEVKPYWDERDGCAIDASNLHYVKGATKEIEKEFPKDSALHEIAKEWTKVQAKSFYQLSASTRASRNLNNQVDVTDERALHGMTSREQDNDVQEVIDNFTHWAHNMYSQELEYQTSEESIELFYDGELFEEEQE